jgi:hypothetical protein
MRPRCAAVICRSNNECMTIAAHPVFLEPAHGIEVIDQ